MKTSVTHPVIHDSLRHGINAVAQMQKAIMSEEISTDRRDLITELKADRAMLDWLIKQGPPGVGEHEWLSEHVWNLATAQVIDGLPNDDADCVRRAIADAMEAKS